MNDTLSLEDEELLARLRALAALHDPVPSSVVEAARSAFALRMLDVELADLLFDSLLDEALVGVRGTPGRQLTFGVGDVTIDLDVDDGGVVGQVTPPGVVTLDVQTPGENRRVAVDELGRFFCDRPGVGPFRLHLEVGGQGVTTEWVKL